MSKITPFDIINDVSFKKEGIINDDNEDIYNPFLVNRGLSYFRDTLPLANIMNEYPNLDKKLQYDFYLNIIRKAKRFEKWHKAVDNDRIRLISEAYKVSEKRAEEILSILTDDQIEHIENLMSKGGQVK